MKTQIIPKPSDSRYIQHTAELGKGQAPAVQSLVQAHRKTQLLALRARGTSALTHAYHSVQARASWSSGSKLSNCQVCNIRDVYTCNCHSCSSSKSWNSCVKRIKTIFHLFPFGELVSPSCPPIHVDVFQRGKRQQWRQSSQFVKLGI